MQLYALLGQLLVNTTQRVHTCLVNPIDGLGKHADMVHGVTCRFACGQGIKHTLFKTRGGREIQLRADMFNALNSSDYYTVTSKAFSPILNTAAASPYAESFTSSIASS